MEYVAAMDIEIDPIIPVRDPQASSLFSIEEDLISEISEKDYDFFMDDVNREMTEVPVLTELGPLPFPIRRNSSRRDNEKASEKENYLSDHPTLLKSYSIPRMDSSERWNNFLGSIQAKIEPLKAFGLTCSSSLRNSCDLIKLNNAEVTTDYRRSKDSHFNQNFSLVKNAARVSQKLHQPQYTKETETETSQAYHECLQKVTSVCEDSQRHQNEEEMLVEKEGNGQALGSEHTLCPRIDGESIHHSHHENSESTSSLTEDERQTVKTYASFCGDSYKKDLFGSRSDDQKETLDRTSSNDVLTKQVVQHHVNESINEESIGNVDEIPKTFTVDMMEASESLKRTQDSSNTPMLNKVTEDLTSLHLVQQVNAPLAYETSGISEVKTAPFTTGKRRVKTDSHEKDQSEIFSNKLCPICQTQCASINRLESLKGKEVPSVRHTPDFKRVTELPSPKKTLMITRKAQMLRRELLNHSVHYASQRKIQLFKAAEEGDLAIIRKLLNPALTAIRHGKKNNTLLHTAAESNQVDVVIHLLDFINPNVINRDGQTPAHVAAVNGHTQIIRILSFNKQFNPDKKDKKQRTFKDLLIAPVFEEVLAGDKKKENSCQKLGEDFDGHVGKLVNGVLTRELMITTPKQLDTAVHGERFLNYDKKGIHQNLTT